MVVEDHIASCNCLSPKANNNNTKLGVNLNLKPILGCFVCLKKQRLVKSRQKDFFFINFFKLNMFVLFKSLPVSYLYINHTLIVRLVDLQTWTLTVIRPVPCECQSNAFLVSGQKRFCETRHPFYPQDAEFSGEAFGRIS